MPARLYRPMHPPWFACTVLACDYRVITYDRRGCGESGDAADGRYDLAAQAADLQVVIEHIGAPANVLAHSAGTLVALELLRANPAIISRAILHEPAVTDEGAGLGAAPVLLEMIAAGKVSRALRAFLGAIGDSDPEAPKLTEAEAKHALRNGRSFMANEYGITMTCVPDWDSVRNGSRRAQRPARSPGSGCPDCPWHPGALTPAIAKADFTRKRFGRVNKCAQNLTSAALIAPSANS